MWEFVSWKSLVLWLWLVVGSLLFYIFIMQIKDGWESLIGKNGSIYKKNYRTAAIVFVMASVPLLVYFIKLVNVNFPMPQLHGTEYDTMIETWLLNTTIAVIFIDWLLLCATPTFFLTYVIYGVAHGYADKDCKTAKKKYIKSIVGQFEEEWDNPRELTFKDHVFEDFPPSIVAELKQVEADWNNRVEQRINEILAERKRQEATAKATRAAVFGLPEKRWVFRPDPQSNTPS